MTIITRSRSARRRISRMQVELRRLPPCAPDQGERSRSVMQAHRNVIFRRGGAR